MIPSILNWRIPLALALVALVSSQSYPPSSYGQQGPPPGQYQPPPGQYQPPPNQQNSQQQPPRAAEGQYPPQQAPPGQPGPQYGAPPQQPQYGGPPPGEYGRRPGGPSGQYFSTTPRGPPPQQQQQQQEGAGLLARLKNKFFVGEDDQPQQGSYGPGPISPYGQRMLPPAPGASPGGPSPPGQYGSGGGGPGQFQSQPSSAYTGPGLPARPQQGPQSQQAHEEGPGLFQKLKSKLVGEDMPQQQPPQGPPGMPRYGGMPPSAGPPQQMGPRYGGPQDTQQQQQQQQMAGPRPGQMAPPIQQQGPPGAPPQYGTQYGAVPPPPPLDTMPPLEEEPVDEEEVPIMKQTEDGTQVFICKPKNLERKKIRIAREGAFNFQVVSRFEKTLTKFRWATADGQQGLPTLSTSQLIEEMMLPEAALKMKELDTEYQKQMEDPEADKQALSEEHFHKMMDLLRMGQLNYFSIPQFVTNFATSVPLRDDIDKLLKTLCWRSVPVTIFSPGFGDIIAQVIAQQTTLADKGALPQNIKILSNFLRSSYDGRCVGTYEPVYFEGNCNLTAASSSSPDQVSTRPNLLVLGSSPDGFNVSPGFNTHDTISVGFMEIGKDFISEFSKFAANYDIVVIGDGSFQVVSEVVEDILGN